MVLVWLKLAICLLIIAVAGRKLAGYGDVIADKTGLGGAWVGITLLALATSLPELFTGISAVSFLNPPSPDLAIGDLLGSNAINIAILILLDLARQNGPVLATVSPKDHLRTIRFSMALVTICVVCILVDSIADFGLGWVGIYSPVIILIFLLMQRSIFRNETNNGSETVEVMSKDSGPSLGQTYFRFAVVSGFVVAGGIWLAFVGDELAEATGWGESFVGTIFLAFTTSFPEITISLSAVRMGSTDMALGNMLGSNMFNMALIGITDIFYSNGSLLADVSETHIATAVVVLAMSAIVIMGLHFRSWTRRFMRLSWYSIALMAIYVIGIYVSFSCGD